ncbi:hypothetical protein IH992_14995 [Candidatus Poribacteria bacterium]|nr:hypothetical protein [Candidatus Poribacteria bacterium]
MAEIVLKVGSSGPDPQYQDGDIVSVFNNLAIDYVHAQHICFPRAIEQRFANKTSDGLLPIGGLEHFFCKTIFQMEFERISLLEVRAKDLQTLEEFVDGPRGWFPKRKLTGWGVSTDGLAQRNRNQVTEYFFDLRPGGTHNDVPDSIKRSRNSNGKLIFGTPGNEVWYGGRMIRTATTVAEVWTEIELKTSLRKGDFTDFPLQDGDKKGFLALTVDDFDEVERASLIASDIDETNLDNPILLKKRKQFVDWKNLTGISGSTIARIEDRDQVVDLRGAAKKHLRSVIVDTKV